MDQLSTYIDSEVLPIVNLEWCLGAIFCLSPPIWKLAMIEISEVDLPPRKSFFWKNRDDLALGIVSASSYFCGFVSPAEMLITFKKTKSLNMFANAYALPSPATGRTVLNKSGGYFDKFLVRQWRSGMSLQRLSRLHGPKPGTIANWLRANGVDIEAGNHLRGVDIEKLCRIIQESGSINRGAKALGIGWRTAKRLYDAADK